MGRRGSRWGVKRLTTILAGDQGIRRTRGEGVREGAPEFRRIESADGPRTGHGGRATEDGPRTGLRPWFAVARRSGGPSWPELEEQCYRYCFITYHWQAALFADTAGRRTSSRTIITTALLCRSRATAAAPAIAGRGQAGTESGARVRISFFWVAAL